MIPASDEGLVPADFEFVILCEGPTHTDPEGDPRPVLVAVIAIGPAVVSDSPRRTFEAPEVLDSALVGRPDLPEGAEWAPLVISHGFPSLIRWGATPDLREPQRAVADVSVVATCDACNRARGGGRPDSPGIPRFDLTNRTLHQLLWWLAGWDTARQWSRTGLPPRGAITLQEIGPVVEELARRTSSG